MENSQVLWVLTSVQMWKKPCGMTSARGNVVVRGRVYSTGNVDQIRVYDGAIDLGNGNYIGIEVKSGSATRNAAQRAFDNWVEAGNPADGIGTAKGFRIVGVRLINR